ncbi:MAG: hypothetical protein KHZ84_01340 [Faecalibacterium prausnitzii]|nr:hypothetical protein [Faecalibacterium prausnitzii]
MSLNRKNDSEFQFFENISEPLILGSVKRAGTQDLTPAASQIQQNKKPAATKISGKEILEAIRLMNADERRELTRALFA